MSASSSSSSSSPSASSAAAQQAANHHVHIATRALNLPDQEIMKDRQMTLPNAMEPRAEAHAETPDDMGSQPLVIQPASPQSLVIQPADPQPLVMQPASPESLVIQPADPQPLVMQPARPQPLVIQYANPQPQDSLLQQQGSGYNGDIPEEALKQGTVTATKFHELVRCCCSSKTYGQYINLMNEIISGELNEDSNLTERIHDVFKDCPDLIDMFKACVLLVVGDLSIIHLPAAFVREEESQESTDNSPVSLSASSEQQSQTQTPGRHRHST